ncbi:MAG TPA: roadblock/LC7 domain-containing protein [Planctomycetota bacterium]|nr:roadblock/LC7 domain-containing protein [Planctomycetota bacterium]
MGWLNNIFGGDSKIKKLEAQLAARPTPAVFVELATLYRDAGEEAKSTQLLKRGASMFPTSNELLAMQKDGEKASREAEKRRLHEKIRANANPILYARLAELYKSDGDLNNTIEVSRAGIKQFPKYGGCFLVLGQVYYERKEIDSARENLEKAVELDKYNYMALKLLAQVYLELNRCADAVKKLEDILYFAPGDEAIKTMLAEAQRVAGVGPGKAPAAGEAAPAPSPAGHKAPAKSADAPAAPRRSASSALKDVDISAEIKVLKEVPGVMGAMLVDAYGLVIASALDDNIEEELAGALITNIYRAASTNAPYMGVGTFEDGVVEGEDGHIHLMLMGDMTLAVFATASLKLGLLEKKIRTFAESILDV